MKDDCKLPCHHTDDVIATKTRLSTVEGRQLEESKKHEDYRSAMHKRLNETNNMINLLRNDVFKSNELVNRRVDSLEHTVQNQAEFITEFKKAVKELSTAVNNFKEYIASQSVKGLTKRTLFYDACKLVALLVGILAILKYSGT